MGIGHNPDNAGTGTDGANPTFWNGLIDELVVYDSPLSTAQINTLFTAGGMGIRAISL